MARNAEVWAKREKVLALRRQGATFEEIAQQVGYSNRSAARRAYEAALADGNVSPTPAVGKRQELDRLERLHRAVWPKAQRGDLGAVDRVVKISEAKMRLYDREEKNQHRLRSAFDATVKIARARELVLDVDEALIETGRAIADRIDEATAASESDRTRVLYLAPHMVNILRELLATPASRRAAVQFVVPPLDGETGGPSGAGGDDADA